MGDGCRVDLLGDPDSLTRENSRAYITRDRPTPDNRQSPVAIYSSPGVDLNMQESKRHNSRFWPTCWLHTKRAYMISDGTQPCSPQRESIRCRELNRWVLE